MVIGIRQFRNFCYIGVFRVNYIKIVVIGVWRLVPDFFILTAPLAT